MQKAAKKDWMLVAVLVAVLIACLCGQLVIRPIREKIDKADERIESLTEKYDTLKSDQNSYRLSAARYNELNAETDALIAQIPNETTAAEVEELVGGLLRDAGMTTLALQIDGPDVHSVPSLLEGADVQNTPLQTFTLHYTASGTYDALLAFCEQVRLYEHLGVSSMDFTFPTDAEGTVDISGDCEAEITVIVYQCRRMAFTTEDVK